MSAQDFIGRTQNGRRPVAGQAGSGRRRAAAHRRPGGLDRQRLRPRQRHGRTRTSRRGGSRGSRQPDDWRRRRFLRAARRADGAGRRHRPLRATGQDRQPGAAGRSLLPSVLRQPVAAAACRRQREGGLGSGVVVRPDGYILTNNHVVDGAEQVKVELTDGRTFKAKVVGTDAPSDLAVLKIDGSQPADPAARRLRQGPRRRRRARGRQPARHRPDRDDGHRQRQGARDRRHGRRQLSRTSSRPTRRSTSGNSGGALVNTQGELIGINSQILSPSGGNIGIGFAIPANMARNVMTQLIEHGQVRRGLLGVTDPAGDLRHRAQPRPRGSPRRARQRRQGRRRRRQGRHAARRHHHRRQRRAR